ncbi:MAG: hypothetical protein JSS84_02835 [Bacteroidetes bacterium]|nr:hypothetical protein [Bacteroidota bacterium]
MEVEIDVDISIHVRDLKSGGRIERNRFVQVFSPGDYPTSAFQFIDMRATNKGETNGEGYNSS